MPKLCDYKINNIKYNPQRDNKIRPSGACNITSLWMMHDQLCENHNISDDNIMNMILSPAAEKFSKLYDNYGQWWVNLRARKRLNTAWKMLEVAAAVLVGLQDSDINGKDLESLSYDDFVNYYNKGINYAKFSYINIKDIKTEIDKGYNIMTGGSFTKSGHIVLIKGYIELPNALHLVINDPWGDYTTGYQTSNGEDSIISYRAMKNLMAKLGTLDKDNYYQYITLRSHPDMKNKIG